MKLFEQIENLVVLLVDMQFGFLGKNGIKHMDLNIITHQIEVLHFCNKKNIPVIVVESALQIFGRTICPLLHLAEKNPRYRYVQKLKNSAFSTKELKFYLDEFNAKTLLLMGVNADACIFDTARAAVEHYSVITSDTLMSGYCLYKEDERKEWYKQNTIYHTQNSNK